MSILTRLHRVVGPPILAGVISAVAVAADAGPSGRPDFRAALVPVEAGNPQTADFSAVAHFWLDRARTRLHYRIRIHGMDVIGYTGTGTTARDDVTKIHLHADSMFGMHTLNVYKAPSQDDHDLVITPAKSLLEGVWDDSDETVHPRHPEHNSSVPLSSQLDNLCADRLWVVVHGDASVVQNPGTYGDRVLAAPIVKLSGSAACKGR